MTHCGPGRDESSRRHLSDTSRRRPVLLIFDVNETLSDMSALEQRFEDVGAPSHLAKSWFASVLRDGFALAAVDASEPFAVIATETLRGSLHGESLSRPLEEAVEHVMGGFSALPVHADIPDAVRTLAESGTRLVTLSNGAATVAEGLLDRAGVGDHFEAFYSVADAGVWKPAARAYAHALERCRVEPRDAVLVAVHPWDIDGAARAGLGTAWINRTGEPYPAHFRAPDLTVVSLTELSDALAAPLG